MDIMTRQVEMKPTIPAHPGLPTRQVWQRNDEHPSRSEQALHFNQGIERRGDMFQNVPKIDDIKRGIGKHPGLERTDTHVERQRFAGMERRRVGQLGSDASPAPFTERIEKMPPSATDVETD